MQRRHFIVCEMTGTYRVREIDAAIARGIRLFGTPEGNVYAVDSTDWTFYFLHSNMPTQQANDVAQQLVEQLAGPEKRDNPHQAGYQPTLHREGDISFN